MNVENLYLGVGGFLPAGLDYQTSQQGAPQLYQGVGPAGRIFFKNVVPLTAQTNNLATSQHMVAATALTLTAGTGVTKTTNAPYGGALSVYQADTQRSIQLTSTANLSAITFTGVGYDEYWNPLTFTMAGPNNNTVISKKSVAYLTSLTPDTTDAGNNVSAGYADQFGMPFAINDATYLVSVLWANSYIPDVGVFTVADQTTPATAATGDVRGTYVPSSASNGSRRLVIGFHLDATQCGPTATKAALFGVTQA